MPHVRQSPYWRNVLIGAYSFRVAHGPVRGQTPITKTARDRLDDQPGADQPVERAAPPRRSWVRPEISELPRLTDLTLQTNSPIDGGGDTGGGGSTVF
jgi:hypothetical protein